MANQESDVRDAETPQKAAEAYAGYVSSMQSAGQTPKSLKDLLG